jgi:hypothetical protein
MGRGTASAATTMKLDDQLKQSFREMRQQQGHSRERMVIESRMCGCVGCIRCSLDVCECGQRCRCKCTVPEIVRVREETWADFERLIDEVLAEPSEREL